MPHPADLRRILGAGLDGVTPLGWFHPDPGKRAELDALCQSMRIVDLSEWSSRSWRSLLADAPRPGTRFRLQGPAVHADRLMAQGVGDTIGHGTVEDQAEVAGNA